MSGHATFAKMNEWKKLCQLNNDDDDDDDIRLDNTSIGTIIEFGKKTTTVFSWSIQCIIRQQFWIKLKFL